MLPIPEEAERLSVAIKEALDSDLGRALTAARAALQRAAQDDA